MSSKQPVREQVTGLIDPASLFADTDGETYARIRRTGALRYRDEVVALRSKSGRNLLLELYREKYGTTPHSQGIEDGIKQLEAIAFRTEITVGLRTMQDGDAIAIDLGDADWRQVAVTRDGWELRESLLDPGPPFRRGAGALPLPIPERGGDLRDLRAFVNVADESDFQLVCAWAVAALVPRGPYPVLVLSGEQGSTKSTTARVLVSLTDPNLAPLIDEPSNNHELSVICGSRHDLALDNLSRVEEKLKNALCRLATGGGHLSRRLYSNGEVCIWQAERPVILTGIDNLLVADDLTDRALAITLPPLPESARKREADFWRDFEAKRPYLFGALLDALVLVLRDQDKIRFARPPRMADFAARAGAAAPAVGSTPDDFLRAYVENRQDAVESGLDASALARVLRQFMDGRRAWTGIYGNLLRELDAVAGDQVPGARGWPTGPRALANQLRRLTPGLRAVGIEVHEMGKGARGKGVAVVSTASAQPAHSAQSPASTLLVQEEGEGDRESDDVQQVHQVQPGASAAKGAIT